MAFVDLATADIRKPNLDQAKQIKQEPYDVVCTVIGQQVTWTAFPLGDVAWVENCHLLKSLDGLQPDCRHRLMQAPASVTMRRCW